MILPGTLFDLLRINAVSKKEREIASYIKKYFSRLGLDVSEDDAGARFGGDTGNIYVFIDGVKEAEPVLFLAHMDTVADTYGSSPVVSGKEIRAGGGAVLGADDRAGIFLICELAQYIVKKRCTAHRPVEVIFTPAEEAGLLGIKNAEYSRIKSRIAFVLDAEGDTGTIITKAPGMERIEARIKGKSAHSGVSPEKGINAIAIAARAIDSIKQGRIDEDTTLNIGRIKGGTADNIVPEYTVVNGEVRSFDRAELGRYARNVEEAFAGAAESAGGSAEFICKTEFSSFDISPDSTAVKTAASAADKTGIKYNITKTGGGSDANILNARGITAVALGIGAYNPHTEKEYLSIEELEKAFSWVVNIAESVI